LLGRGCHGTGLRHRHSLLLSSQTIRYGWSLLRHLSARLRAGKVFCHLLSALQLSRNQKKRRLTRGLAHHLLKRSRRKAFQSVFLFKY
tara:strand:- start:870 stop:1133 length:264 start_codon:yes stop_codon:yes gene_type:complete